ncbi:9497_t:CDS:1, partial [Entrophospora sp. SA101]
MLDEFINSHNNLRTDFDPALMQPISFPQGEMMLKLGTFYLATFDLLED